LFIIGVLLFSAIVAYKARPSEMIMILVLLGVVGSVLTFMCWPPLGLIIASVVGLVIPFLGPSGLSVTMIVVALLVGLWLLDMLVRQRDLRLVSSRTIWPLLAFVIVAIFSFGLGLLPWFTFAPHAPLGAQLGGLSIVVFLACTFLLVANQIHDLGWLRRMTWVFLAFAALQVLIRSVLPEAGLPTRNLLQPTGAAFSLWLVAMAFSQAVFNRDLHLGWRLALAGLVLTSLYVAFILKFADKSVWIPPLVCIAAIIGFRSWRAGLVMALAGALVALYLKTSVMATDEYSVATRFDAWLIMAEIIKTNPVWGLGFANYYWYTPLFPIRGYAVQFNSHNNYVDIIAQTGLVGLVCFLWFLGEVGWLGWRLRKHAPPGFARAYVYGAFGGLVGTAVLGMLGDWVIPFFYNIGLQGFRSAMLPWLFLGGLVSLEQIARQERIKQEESSLQSMVSIKI
jgi:hypothetical protein